MDTDRGLARRLPPPPENKDQKQDDIIVKERNVLQVRLNKDDQLMCGQDYIDIKQLKEKAKEIGIKGYTKMTKEELEDAIKNSTEK